MKKYTRPIDLMRAQEARFKRAKKTAREMFLINFQETYQDAIEASSGKTSTKQLRKEGHPYARGVSASASTKGGLKRGRRPSFPVNAQTGRLRRAWQASYHSGPGRLTATLTNRAPHSKFVLAPAGTRRMVARGVWGSKLGQPSFLARRWKARNKALVTELRRRRRSIT